VKAIRQNVLGGPEVLEVVEVERPEPAPTEVLVRVRTAGVNPVDWKTRTNGAFLGSPPFTVGWDVAGTVEEVGRGVTRFAPGDRVFGMPRFPKEAAAYAEFATSPSRQLARIPDALSDVEAGALPLAALTAWQALVETAGIARGQRVLILGAAGGVGHLAVQIAKSRGAYVIGTASAGKHAFLAELGADEAVDYTSEAVEERVHDADVLLDLVGGDGTAPALAALRDGGLAIVIPSAASIDALRAEAGSRVRITGLLVEPDRAGLEAIADLAALGRLRPTIAGTFPLAEAGRAHAAGETGRTQGKLVLVVD
jgi:NADPH:quinone reductase-like Zn-dependent oxidoreductase